MDKYNRQVSRDKETISLHEPKFAKIQSVTTRPERYPDHEYLFESSVADKHIGKLGPAPYGEEMRSAAGAMYAALPASIASIESGLHPLTLPGQQVPYFGSHIFAEQFASRGSTPVSMTITCKVPETLTLQDYTLEDLTCIGLSTLPRNAVQEVYTMIRDGSHTYTLDTTGLNLQQYQMLATLAKQQAEPEVVQQCVQAWQHSIKDLNPEIIHLLNQLEDASLMEAARNSESFSDLLATSQIMQSVVARIATMNLNGERDNQGKADVPNDIHTQQVNSTIDTFWTELMKSASQRTDAKFGEFHEKVTQAARTESIRDAMLTGCDWLRSQAAFLDRNAIDKAWKSDAVQAQLDSVSPRAQVITIGDILHNPDEVPSEDENDLEEP